MQTIATTKLESISPYGQSKFISIPRNKGETAADHETRCWHERCHYDDKGKVFIPPMQFRNSLMEAAKFLGLQVPGKGKTTYTKHFEAGIMVIDGLELPWTIEEVKEKQMNQHLMLNSDGKRGGGTRVEKIMPRFPKWSGEVVWHVIDPVISKEVFTECLNTAGLLVGIGFWRPRQSGMWGRFRVLDLKWESK